MKDEIKKRIYDAVDLLEDEIVKAVSDMVQIPSVTPEFAYEPEYTADGETKVSRYMQKIMEDMGLKTDLFAAKDNRNNVVGIYESAKKGKSILFNGHVDVVPPGDLSLWGAEPFSGKVENGFIYGRGSVDMKGGNAAALYALKAILNAGFKPQGDVIFHNAVGEECKVTEAGTGACLEKGYTADAAVVCEPTCGGVPFEINPAQSGIFEMKWEVKGKACHAGLRREVIRDGGAGAAVGVDAIEKGMIIYKAIKDLELQWGQSKKHEMYKPGNFCINGSVINAGVAPSIVAEKMEMTYAIFYPPQDTPEGIKKEIEAQIHNACQNDSWLKENPPEITWIFNWPSFDVSIEEEICKTAQRCVQEVVPQGGAFTGMFAVCDASFIFEKNIPVIVLGPGETKYTHGVEEKLEISQLIKAAKIYALIIADWCGIS